MGLTPKFEKKRNFLVKTCTVCGHQLGADEFAPTKSFFYPDGTLPICNDCLNAYLSESEYSWDVIDKTCQYADIPFIPSEWVRIQELHPEAPFGKYAEVFMGDEYEGLGWDDYFKEFKQLEQEGNIRAELPLLGEERRRELKERWGANYDDEALVYLENLYSGLCSTQNIAGALQIDQALKICKMSYEIDCRIRAGEDFDKILSAYDKIVKAADFTPKSAKNASDFESVGELFRWLEKRGWKNQYFDNVSKDIVDETIKNIQAWSQRLYTEESGIGDEITRRIEALKTAKTLEDDYYITDSNTADDLDKYQNDGFDRLFKDEEFNAEIDE